MLGSTLYVALALINNISYGANYLRTVYPAVLIQLTTFIYQKALSFFVLNGKEIQLLCSKLCTYVRRQYIIYYVHSCHRGVIDQVLAEEPLVRITTFTVDIITARVIHFITAIHTHVI